MEKRNTELEKEIKEKDAANSALTKRLRSQEARSTAAEENVQQLHAELGTPCDTPSQKSSLYGLWIAIANGLGH
jgi:septal ring factor EnvC (AmiA/AmiB activator)